MNIIKKFVIEIDGVTYEMDYAQAEKLYAELSKIFEKKIEYVQTYPWPNYPQYPYVVYTSSSTVADKLPLAPSTYCQDLNYKVY